MGTRAEAKAKTHLKFLDSLQPSQDSSLNFPLDVGILI